MSKPSSDRNFTLVDNRHLLKAQLAFKFLSKMREKDMSMMQVAAAAKISMDKLTKLLLNNTNLNIAMDDVAAVAYVLDVPVRIDLLGSDEVVT